MGVEDLVLKLCVWYKSTSIVTDNAAYTNCHLLCNGYNKACSLYTPKQDYFKAKLETCKKLNSK